MAKEKYPTVVLQNWLQIVIFLKIYSTILKSILMYCNLFFWPFKLHDPQTINNVAKTDLGLYSANSFLYAVRTCFLSEHIVAWPPFR